MKNTQANKLHLVLKNGTLRQVKINELLCEIDSFNLQSVMTKEEQYHFVLESKNNGQSCWEFTPNNPSLLDYAKVRKFSVNPYSLIDYIYNKIK